MTAKPDVRAVSASTLAAVGIVDWALQTYVFHGPMPDPVASGLYVLFPALIGFIGTHIALNTRSPADAAETKRVQDAIVSAIQGRGPSVLPRDPGGHVAPTPAPTPTPDPAQPQPQTEGEALG